MLVVANPAVIVYSVPSHLSFGISSVGLGLGLRMGLGLGSGLELGQGLGLGLELGEGVKKVKIPQPNS